MPLLGKHLFDLTPSEQGLEMWPEEQGLQRLHLSALEGRPILYPAGTQLTVVGRAAGARARRQAGSNQRLRDERLGGQHTMERNWVYWRVSILK